MAAGFRVDLSAQLELADISLVPPAGRASAGDSDGRVVHAAGREDQFG